jgi:hypothetical protein
VRICKHLSLGLLILCPALGPSQENAKPAPVKGGERLTGLWRGEYQYPGGGGQAPVRFELVLLQDGSTVGGVIKEPNTFGSRPGPFLAAVIKGSFDAQAGKLIFRKTYDGTLGPNHDVEYTGQLSKDGTKFQGNWDLGGGGGTFTLERVKGTHAGPFAGVWSGMTYRPKGKEFAPVSFQMIMVHDGDGVTGLIKEPNTSQVNKDEPYLHAAFKGKYDPKTGKLAFQKTYDGTAGETREVACSGKASFDKMMVEGLWTIRDDGAGRLTLLRQRLDEKTVASLR